MFKSKRKSIVARRRHFRFIVSNETMMKCHYDHSTSRVCKRLPHSSEQERIDCRAEQISDIDVKEWMNTNIVWKWLMWNIHSSVEMDLLFDLMTDRPRRNAQPYSQRTRQICSSQLYLFNFSLRQHVCQTTLSRWPYWTACQSRAWLQPD